MASVSVRYIVDDVTAAIAFYCDQLDFHEIMHPAPTFAMLDRGELRLVLSAPSSQGGGGQAMPDGTEPEPGGWNRFVIEVDDIADRVQLLRQRGVHFRNDIVEGSAESRSCSRILSVIPSSCSSPSSLRLASQTREYLQAPGPLGVSRACYLLVPWETDPCSCRWKIK
jgi:catechol 2,3-dioxygenase-like lactoylglutathione lyase family enzyme